MYPLKIPSACAFFSSLNFFWSAAAVHAMCLRSCDFILNVVKWLKKSRSAEMVQGGFISWHKLAFPYVWHYSPWHHHLQKTSIIFYKNHRVSVVQHDLPQELSAEAHLLRFFNSANVLLKLLFFIPSVHNVIKIIMKTASLYEAV